jgi:hypothetical protein
MENIGASYKYPRKSPCEAKAYYFVLASSIFATFDNEKKTLLIFSNKFKKDFLLQILNFGIAGQLRCFTWGLVDWGANQISRAIFVNRITQQFGQ